MPKFYTVQEFEALVRERVKPRPKPKYRLPTPAERRRMDALRSAFLRDNTRRALRRRWGPKAAKARKAVAA